MRHAGGPVIGIVTYHRNDAGRFDLPAEYVDAVRRAGGLPLLVAPGETRLDETLALLDGLLLAGGGDVAPALYGGGDHPAIERVDADRDATELALLRGVLASGLPCLPICRGCQLLDVALGGTLLQHLPDDAATTPGAHAGGALDGAGGAPDGSGAPPRTSGGASDGAPAPHRSRSAGPPEARPAVSIAHAGPEGEAVPHAVAVQPGSRLADILECTRMSPLSKHHQAIGRLGDGLVVAATAPDGVVEAVELRDHPWLLAVQWHPELTAAHDPTQQRLFDAFVAAAAAATPAIG